MINKGVILVFLAGVFWGFNGVFVEYICNVKGFDVNHLVSIRFILAGILLLLYCFISKIPFKKELFTNKSDLLKLLSYSVFGLFMCQYFYYYAITLSNAAIATVIQFISPVIIILYVCYEEKRRPSIKEVLAFSFVFLGVFLLVTNGDFTKLYISLFALLMCIIAMFGGVFNTIIPRSINLKYHPTYILGISMSLVGLIFGIKEKVWNAVMPFDIGLIVSMMCLIVFGTVVSFSFYMIGLSKIGAAKATIIGSNVPIITVIASYIFLDTRLEILQIIGFILIMLAIFLAILKSNLPK